MRLLFLKTSLDWPRTTGHDVHCFEMMRALGALGHDVRLATTAAPPPRALDGLALTGAAHVDGILPAAEPVMLSYLQARYCRYWGIEPMRLQRVRAAVAHARPDVLVAVGPEMLPCLAAARGTLRVWYAADEWVRHHLTQAASRPGDAWPHLRAAVVKGLHERAFASVMDRIWVVSDAERRAMRRVTGVATVDVVPNGVDIEAFAPTGHPVAPRSAVFWGRLAFGPNRDALRWFCTRVWPEVRRRAPDATFTILGSDPPVDVREFAGREGVTLLANLPDLREVIDRHAVAVMPFPSGGGIKNKLLEAAAMAKPIVATPAALVGLRGTPPVAGADTPERFADALCELWRDPDRARALGAQARTWVAHAHTWRAAAAAAIAGIETSLGPAATSGVVA